ncbi:MAG: hypothetical protein ACLFOC_05175 [Campylobacterales bacterium]
MVKKTFKVLFHSDIVLNSSSATTMGTSDTLDYIAGSNFLGMVASHGGYDSFKEKAFDVFHSGKVRFGDAHVFKDTPSLKLPFCYFINKGEKLEKNTTIYYHHLLTKEKREELKLQGIQLKQVRDGYFNLKGELLELDYSYTQKSSYNSEKRRSKDKAMFGYKAIKRGVCFVFDVGFDDESLIEDVTKGLVGFKKLGKSKNSQYGKVEIKEFNSNHQITQKPIEDNLILLYAKSNLALIDKDGNPIATPNETSLKLPNGCSIDFEKSQIRTRSYSPYNVARDTRDYERVIIEKGSVVAVNISSGFNLNSYENALLEGVGSYLSEGFGEVVVNPEFLYEMSFADTDRQKEILGLDIEDRENSKLSDYLKNRFNQKELDKDMMKIAFENRDKFEKTTTSQWGQIRTLASQYSDDEIIKELNDYLNNGVAKDRWKEHYSKLETLISTQPQKARFTKLLAIEVSKYLKQKEKGEKSENN